MHYNRSLTDNIQNYIIKIDERIRFLFKPFESFSRMDSLFGLGSNYLYDQRNKKKSKKIIAIDFLDKMRLNLKMKIQNWIKNYPDLSNFLLNAQKDIMAFIDEYEKNFNPKPSSRYQMYIHHPNFIRNYFNSIDTKEKAYWLGFLYADGWIIIQHLTSGDYYRMGIELSEKDRGLIENFCKAVGLNPKYIRKNIRKYDYTNKTYPVVEIRWGDQNFANDLIKLGMKYELDEKKGRRIKMMSLLNFNKYDLMLAFLLGFYDGDGSLGWKGKNSIYPTIKSSNKKFLLQIKEYFGIKDDVKPQSKEKYDYWRKISTISEYYYLHLPIELFKKMLSNYRISLKRKRVPFHFFVDYGLTTQQKWIRGVFEKDDLEKILNFLSPNFIANKLGVSTSAIKWLAEEIYGIELRKDGREYYNRINKSIEKDGINSPYYEEYQYWNKFLGKLEKF